MNRVSYLGARTAVIAVQMPHSTTLGSMLYARLVHPCTQCYRRLDKTQGILSQLHLRTLSQSTRTMLPMSTHSRSTGLSHGHSLFVNINPNRRVETKIFQQPKNLCPMYTSTRSIVGISVSGPGSNDTMYIPTPTEKCYELLEHIHDSVGLPWWLTILATTILLRGVFVFPFAVWQQRVLARIENAQPMINAYVEQIKQQLAIVAKEEGWSQRKMANVFSKEIRLLVSNVHFQNHCSSYKLAYLPFFQACTWVTMTTAIGQMTGKYPDLFSTELDIDVLPALASEGFLWFSDLMQMDVTLALLLGIVNVTLVELWSLRRGPLTRTQHYLQNTFRIIAICSMPAAAMLPSAISFYWLTSSLCGLGQLALLRSPPARRMLGIPHAPSEMKRPFAEMKTALKARYAKKAF